MNSKYIKNEEYESLKISSLPTSPTASISYGGYGYSAAQMKQAFDALPLFVLEKLNMLISDICADAENSVSGAIKTGIADGHTLKSLFDDITNGALAGYLKIGSENLITVINDITAELEEIKGRLDR